MIWNAAHPENYYLRRQKAADLMEAKRWADAKPALESLAESYHGEKGAENPLWLLSVTEKNLNETNAELATLQKFAAQESDFVPLFARLINLSEARGDWPAVASYADRLLAINPLTSLPHDALAKAGVAIGKRDLSITSYRKLLLLDPPDPTEIHFQLASLLHARGNSESEAKRQVLQALEEAPRFRDAQKLLLELTEKTSQPKAGATTSKPRESP